MIYEFTKDIYFFSIMLILMVTMTLVMMRTSSLISRVKNYELNVFKSFEYMSETFRSVDRNNEERINDLGDFEKRMIEKLSLAEDIINSKNGGQISTNALSSENMQSLGIMQKDIDTIKEKLKNIKTAQVKLRALQKARMRESQ